MGNTRDLKRRSGKSYHKVRRFVSNRHFRSNMTVNAAEQTSTEDGQTNSQSPVSPSPLSARYRKLASSGKNIKLLSKLCTETLEVTAEEWERNSFHYLFLDSRVLETILSVSGCCPFNDITKKKGLSNYIEIECRSTDCEFHYSTYTSRWKEMNKVQIRSISTCSPSLPFARWDRVTLLWKLSSEK